MLLLFRKVEIQISKELQRSYYAIIPANVRYDKDLTPNAKLLYGEITALCNEKGYCWATNEYFSNLYGVSKVSISNWISDLVQKGYIKSDIIYKEGTRQIENRYLRIFYDPIKENFNTPIKEIFNTPIKENFKGNNTIINNTDINNTINNTTTTEYELVDQFVTGENSMCILRISNAQVKMLKELLSVEELDYYLNKMCEMIANEYTFSCSHYNFILKMWKEDRKV